MSQRENREVKPTVLRGRQAWLLWRPGLPPSCLPPSPSPADPSSRTLLPAASAARSPLLSAGRSPGKLLPQGLRADGLPFARAGDGPQHAGLCTRSRQRAPGTGLPLVIRAGSVGQLQPRGRDGPKICPQAGAGLASGKAGEKPGTGAGERWEVPRAGAGERGRGALSIT